MSEPGEGEVRIKVEAIGLNRAEVMFRQGQYLEAPVFPSRLEDKPPALSKPWGRAPAALKSVTGRAPFLRFPLVSTGSTEKARSYPPIRWLPIPTSFFGRGRSNLDEYMTAFGAPVEYGRLRKKIMY